MNVFKFLQMVPLLIEVITELITSIKKLSDAVDANTLVSSHHSSPLKPE